MQQKLHVYYHPIQHFVIKKNAFGAYWDWKSLLCPHEADKKTQRLFHAENYLQTFQALTYTLMVVTASMSVASFEPGRGYCYFHNNRGLFRG